MKRRSFLKLLSIAPVITVIPVTVANQLHLEDLKPDFPKADKWTDEQINNFKTSDTIAVNRILTLDEITKEALRVAHSQMKFKGVMK